MATPGGVGGINYSHQLSLTGHAPLAPPRENPVKCRNINRLATVGLTSIRHDSIIIPSSQVMSGWNRRGGVEKDPQWKRWETVSMGTSRAGSRHFKLMRQVVNISFYLGVNKSGKRRAALPTVINVRPFKRQASIAPLYHRRPNPVGCRPLLVAIVPSTSSSSYLGAFFTCFKYRHVRLLQILLKLISR